MTTSHARRFEYGELDYEPTLPAMWQHIVDRHGDNEFIVSLRDDDTTERMTYSEADARSAEMARSLLALGVSKGTRVGILAPNGTEFVTAFLAAARVGAVPVPLNTFFQPAELGWVLRDADIHTVLYTPALLGKDMDERLEAAVTGLADNDRSTALALPDLPALRWALPLGDAAWSHVEPVSEAMLEASERGVRTSDDLVVIYTSGSMADPKGIIHPHGTAIRHSHFIASQHQWTADDRVYVPMAFFWVGGLVFGVLGPLQIGVTIITEHRFEPGPVLRLLAAERATYATGFPHVGPALANHPDFASTDLSSLREGYQQVLLPTDRRTADPTLRVAQLGMTETCSSHTWWPPHEELPESKRGSLGVSAPGFEHKVIDADGNVVPPGEVGEICVRGHALMRGMVGRTRDEVFDREGWYHTGDAARMDEDGHLYFGGRTDDMIKTSGANVSPVEVEGVLAKVPEVRIPYVVGVPDPEKGALVTAVVVLNEGEEISPDELRSWCREHLAAYKVPKRWELLHSADQLPYGTTNKIDKRALVELLSAGPIVEP